MACLPPNSRLVWSTVEPAKRVALSRASLPSPIDSSEVFVVGIDSPVSRASLTLTIPVMTRASHCITNGFVDPSFSNRIRSPGTSLINDKESNFWNLRSKIITHLVTLDSADLATVPKHGDWSCPLDHRPKVPLLLPRLVYFQGHWWRRHREEDRRKRNVVLKHPNRETKGYTI